MILDYKTFLQLHTELLTLVTFGQKINKQTKNKQTNNYKTQQEDPEWDKYGWAIFTGKEKMFSCSSLFTWQHTLNDNRCPVQRATNIICNIAGVISSIFQGNCDDRQLSLAFILVWNSLTWPIQRRSKGWCNYNPIFYPLHFRNGRQGFELACQ